MTSPSWVNTHCLSRQIRIKNWDLPLSAAQPWITRLQREKIPWSYPYTPKMCLQKPASPWCIRRHPLQRQEDDQPTTITPSWYSVGSTIKCSDTRTHASTHARTHAQRNWNGRGQMASTLQCRWLSGKIKAVEMAKTVRGFADVAGVTLAQRSSRPPWSHDQRAVNKGKTIRN